jgi:hypothetical protein
MPFAHDMPPPDRLHGLDLDAHLLSLALGYCLRRITVRAARSTRITVAAPVPSTPLYPTLCAIAPRPRRGSTHPTTISTSTGIEPPTSVIPHLPPPSPGKA